MKKRGRKKAQFFEVAIASIVIILSLAGAIFVVNEGSKVYVGEKNTSTFYEFSSCKNEVSQIDDSQIVIFQSKKQAEDLSYFEIKCQKN